MVAAFDGGAITSDAGALLLGATDRAVGLIDRFAACFVDRRDRRLIEHELRTLVGQRVLGIALGYEDLIDHDELRHDPVLAVLAGKLRAKRRNCAPLAGKSTLNRLELGAAQPSVYHKIGYRPAAIEALFVRQFVAAHRVPPAQIVLDMDATDDPLHGHQEGRFFHGYYDGYTLRCRCTSSAAGICWRPRRRANIDASAGAVEEVARIVGQLRRRWPHVRILLRADSGFAREALMASASPTGSTRLVRAGAQSPAGGGARERRWHRDAGRGRGESATGAALQGLPVVDPRQLVAPAPRGGQGGMDRRQGQPPLRGDLAEA